MIKNNRNILTIIFTFLLIIGLSACQHSWEITITDPSGADYQIANQDVDFYIEKSKESIQAVPFGQLVYHYGYTLIESISLEFLDGSSEVFDWDEIAPSTVIYETGEIEIGNDRYKPDQIHVKPSNLAAEIDYSIMDIAPTVAFALGLPELEDSLGQVIVTSKGDWDHAVMILLDGLQFEFLETAIKNDDVPFIQQLDQPQKGLTVFPPITTAASAAVLTGTTPQINRVYGYGYRETDQTTLFDLAVKQGKKVAAIEGASLPFNLREAEITLSGDKDGNGFSDDNVLKNSLDIIQSGMPDLLYIHFHEIDDMGHTYGPDSDEYLSALQRVDAYLAQIYDALPPETFIVIFADHGMHATIDGGNHGTLTEEDLVIPILFLEK